MANQPFNIRIFSDQPDQRLDPTTLSVGDLGVLLLLIRDLVGETSLSRGLPYDKRSLPLSLTGVSAGSAVYCVEAPPDLYPVLEQIETAIITGDLTPLTPTARQGLYRLKRLATARAWQLHWGFGTDTQAAIVSKDWQPIKEFTFRSETTLYGEVVKVNGRKRTKPSAQLKLGNGRFMTVQLQDAKQTRQLASAIFQEVGLAGVGTYHSGTLELIRFRVAEILPYEQPGSIVDALQELSEGYGSTWTFTNENNPDGEGP